MTGFFATFTGLSFRNDSLIARRTISGSKSGRDRAPFEISTEASCFASFLLSTGGEVTADMISSSFKMTLKKFSVQHLEMLDDRT